MEILLYYPPVVQLNAVLRVKQDLYTMIMDNY